MSKRNRQQHAAPPATPVAIESAIKLADAPLHGPERNPKYKVCACGCGGWTRGGTWLPGHDAKAASAAKAAAGTLRKMPRACKCGCDQMTKGGIFCPGHDARYHSAQRTIAATQAIAA